MSVYGNYLAQISPYLDHKVSSAHLTAPVAKPTDLPALRNTLGGKVLARNPGADFQRLFDAFLLESDNFVWRPTEASSHDKILATLDGERTSGECRILASALYLLWVLPAPFGLDQYNAFPAAEVIVFNNNNKNEGFIAPHPLGGVRGLMPNMEHPMKKNTFNPLYEWDNHKVVKYDDVLWDPSYKCKFESDQEMVAFSFTSMPVMVGMPPKQDRDARKLRVVTATPSLGWIAGQTMYMRYRMSPFGRVGPYRVIA